MPLRTAAAAVLFSAALLITVPVHSQAQDAAETSTRKVLVKTPVIYPTLARSMNIRGVAKVEAVVSPNGTVKSVVVKGGHPILAQSAVNSVGKWKFEPAAKETTELIEVKFDPQ